MRTGGSVAGAVAAALIAGCLENNPWFTEPTTTDSASATTTTGTPGGPTSDVTTGGPTSETTTSTTTPTSTGMETDSPVVTEGSTMTTAPLTTTTMTTDVPSICGDGVVEGGEECDEGPANDDEGACTTFCLHATCGDGFVQSGEDCDDKNPDSNDGCVACVVPNACKEIRELDPFASTGLHKIDPDGPGLMLIPVFCDMTLDGGGWTLVERSPASDPIGVALYKDFAQNAGNPMAPRYRMPRGAMSTVVAFSAQMRLDCGGSDHLVAAAEDLFAGEFGPQDCTNAGPVLYAEAELMGVVRMNILMCTQFPGLKDGQCPGAWSIDEENQSPCQLDNHPWIGGETDVLPMTDAFAVDPQNADPAHDCHKPNATRQILVR